MSSPTLEFVVAVTTRRRRADRWDTAQEGRRHRTAGVAGMVWCAGSSGSWYRTIVYLFGGRGGLCVVCDCFRGVAGSSLSASSLESSYDCFFRMAGRPGLVS